MAIPSRQLRIISAEDIRRSPEKIFKSDQCGFFLCLEGNGVISFFNRNYEIRRGSLALFHPFVKITFKDFTDVLSGFWGESDLAKALPMVNRVLNVENIEIIKSEPVVLIKSTLFENLFEKITDYLREREELESEIATDEMCSPICKVLLATHDERLLLEILRLYYLSKSRPITPTTRHDLVFQKFMIDLQTQYMNHRDTMFYALRSSLSPKYFSAVIKSVSGAAPQDWIVQTVISMAQNYLLDTSKTIKEISALLGFPSQAFFCKYFKRYTSLSPKVYRAIYGLHGSHR